VSRGELERTCQCGTAIVWNGRGRPTQDCEKCRKLKAAIRRVRRQGKKNPERLKREPQKTAPEGFRFCISCNKLTLLQDMHLRWGRILRSSICRKCHNEKCAKKARRRADIKNPNRSRRKLHLDLQPGKKYCRHCEEHKTFDEMYKQPSRANPASICQTCYKKRRVVFNTMRKARVASASGRFNKDDLQQKRILQGDACFYCHALLNGMGEVEHKIPLSRGGTNWPANLCLACRSCNASKWARTPQEFKVYRESVKK